MHFKIDMVNLHLIIKKDMFLGLGGVLDGQEFVQKILFNVFDSEFTFYETNKFSAYKYNITHKTIEGTVFYGLMHNSKNSKDEIDIKIEYNPSKFKEVPYRIRSLCSMASVVKIKSFDYALDININKNSIVFGEALKNVNVYKGTYYIGQRSNGIKIYDKAKEQGLEGVELTRIEYRIPINYICKSVGEFEIEQHLKEFIFPDICYYDNFHEEDLDVEMLLILEGLQHRPELYKKLTRRKKEKIKNALNQLAKVEYSALLKDMKHYLKKYIDTIIIY